MPYIDLSSLNSQQKEAVLERKGVIVVPAIPGSGKTKVLTTRVAYHTQVYKTSPKNMLVTTFSKEAALSMAKRLGDIVKPEVTNGLTIGTIHSLGYRILAREYKRLGDPRAEAFQFNSNKLLGDAGKRALIERIIEENKYEFEDREMNTRKILHIIAKSKNAMVDDFTYKFTLEPDSPKDLKTVADIYMEYEDRKRLANQIDFDDMLMLFWQLLCEHDDICQYYQLKFKHILSDESQDMNQIMYEILKLLAQPHNNIFLIGDEDQSIYGFNGAVPANFVNFANEYPGAKIITLKINYRSRPQILEAADKLIKNNPVRIDKELIAFNNQKAWEKGVVNFNEYGTEHAEAKGVVTKIKELAGQGIFYNDMAVLYRMNAQSRALESVLLEERIPYEVIGGQMFFERAEVKDLLAYLRLAVDPHDDEAFERVMNKPKRGLWKAALEALNKEAFRRRCSLYDAAATVQLKFRDQREGLRKFIDAIDAGRGRYLCGDSTASIIDAMGDVSGYYASLKQDGGDEDNDDMENIHALQDATISFGTPEDFLEYVRDVTTRDKHNTDLVKLMTLHKSKGLEFKNVFLIGMIEGFLPHQRAIEESEVCEEERCLAYVGVTRAQHKLFISSPMTYWGKQRSLSRFVYEMELQLAEEEAIV